MFELVAEVVLSILLGCFGLLGVGCAIAGVVAVINLIRSGK